MPDVFLSYTRADSKAAGRLVEALRALSFDVWWDRDIPAGAPWEAAIERALADSKVLLVCWSPTSIGSENVRSEARWAREHGRLIQVFIKPCEPPLFFGERQGIDLEGWNGRATNARFQQLAGSIRDALGGAASPWTTRAALPVKASLRRWVLAGAVGALLLLLAGFALWRGGSHIFGAGRAATEDISRMRVAAPHFDLLDSSDPALRKFSAGLQAEMVDQLNENGVNVIGAGSGANGGVVDADFTLGGTIERDGDAIVVREQLTDVPHHATLWSTSYNDSLERSAVLQTEIAVDAAQIVSSAEDLTQSANGDPATLTLLLKADFYGYANRDEDREAEWEMDKEVVAKFPQLSEAHSSFAIVSAFLATTSSGPRAAELRGIARSEADAALRLDPKDALAYFARSLLFPMVGHWGERESELLAGLKVHPDSALLTTQESNLLREVGRLDDALAFARQSAAPRPPSPNRDSTLLIALSETGHLREAASLIDSTARAWPTFPAVWNAQLQALIHAQRWNDALKLFDARGYRPEAIGDAETRGWTTALKAMASKNLSAKRDAARLLAALPMGASSSSKLPHLVYSPAEQIAMLAILGSDDAAYTAAGSYLQRNSLADASFLFWPELQQFRSDPRFWPLVTRLGFVDYWQRANTAPGACSEAALANDCRNARLTAHG